MTRSPDRTLALGALALLAVVSILFLAFPAIDIAASRLFYDPATGFLARRLALIEHVRKAGIRLEWTFASAICVPFLLKLLFPPIRLPVSARSAAFVLGSFLVGPGLVVNGNLKTFWGRARPASIVEFGGEAAFSPVWWISDQCLRNCSFVAGEAASAFWLVAVVFLVPPRWRPPTAAAALLLASVFSLMRIAAGAHFLSDVLIAWLLTLLVILLVKRLVLDGLPQALDVAVEAALEHGAMALRGFFERDRRRLALLALPAAATLFFVRSLGGETALHEGAETAGLVLICAAVSGRAWSRFHLPAGPLGWRCDGLLLLCSACAALGIGLQTGSVTIGLVSATLALGARLPGRHRDRAAPARPALAAWVGFAAIRPSADVPRRAGAGASLGTAALQRAAAATLLEALLFLSAIPICEGVERLQDVGYLAPQLYLP